MANELSTAGISLGYAVETTAGTKPTTGYTNIPNVKSIGGINGEPNSYDATDLSDTEWKRYKKGLKDPGGSIAVTANFTKAFKTAWAASVTAAATALAGGKAMWYQVKVPNFGDFYFTGEPDALGLPDVDTDGLFSGDAHIVPGKVEGWADSSDGE